jgi:hypothetical protein
LWTEARWGLDGGHEPSGEPRCRVRVLPGGSAFEIDLACEGQYAMTDTARYGIVGRMGAHGQRGPR